MRYALTILLASAFSVHVAHAQEWQPVTGKAALSELVSNTQLEGTLKYVVNHNHRLKRT